MKKMLFWIFLFLIASSSLSLAVAVEPDEILKDAALESRARDISSNLRCPVCQNQSIDDSESVLARDLRLFIRERLKMGDSDQQIIDFLVERYGEFILLKPPLKKITWFLWFSPLIVMMIGIGIIFLGVRRCRHEKAIAYDTGKNN
ncbi:cytochrome c-type biogenesis protein [Bartonella sp. CB178]|uniref:cytochrome c-type biogenesis protein n=1 Tax=Bartonella sp. CB178 TaxID=3112255 RepID=UPI00300E460F